MPAQRRYLKMDEAAEYLGLSLHALKQRVYRRTVPFVRMGHSIRFDRFELDKWLSQNRVGVASEVLAHETGSNA